MPERVLLLGDDLRAFLAIARSLGRRGVEVHAAPSDFSSPALKSRWISDSHRLPPYPLDPQAWETALKRLISDWNFLKVVPTSDSGLFMLRHHSEALGRDRVAIANEAALEIFSDKANTRALAEIHGVPVARGRLIGGGDTAEDLAGTLGLPLVLKPRASYALGDIATKRSARVVRDLAGLERQLRTGDWDGCVAESFFPGVGVGLSVLAREGRILFAYQHRRLQESSETGASTRRVTEPADPALLAAAEPLAQAAKLDGVAMFEFRLDRRSGRHILLEVNPRFWGSLPLAVAAGADFPALWWDVAVHGRERGGRYRGGVLKADLTGEFDRVVDRLEAASGFRRLSAACSGLATALMLLTARDSADSWAADDPAPWIEERRTLAARTRQALARRMPGRLRRHRIRFEDVVRRISEKAQGRPLRLTVVGRDNVCRSAFGERLLRLRLAGLAVEIGSAGYEPKRGLAPSESTVSAAARFGVDLAGHRSSAMSVEQLERADALILIDDDMEWRLRQMSPAFTGEVVTLLDGRADGAETFPAIAAALTRLAAVVKGSHVPGARAAEAEPSPLRRQAA
ncbi:MAG TPA: ATP-grasp domain-containing protein [Allosphingosinicella sp.]|jgi:predicted ATP-grasp superfamily ATP-dependent carboligase/protein-tyrosine-phosphatase|nr:ATP-grasp domain-containing protein [Allosphingosinicella sp.]